MRNRILIMFSFCTAMSATLYGANGSPAEPAKEFDKLILEAIQEEGKIRGATQALERVKDAIGKDFASSESYTSRRAQLTEVNALHGIGSLSNINDGNALAVKLDALMKLMRQTKTKKILEKALEIADGAIKSIKVYGAGWNLGPLTALTVMAVPLNTDGPLVASKLGEISDALEVAKSGPSTTTPTPRVATRGTAPEFAIEQTAILTPAATRGERALVAGVERAEYVPATTPVTPISETARTVRVAPQRGILTEEPGMETAEVLPMIEYTPVRPPRPSRPLTPTPPVKPPKPSVSPDIYVGVAELFSEPVTMQDLAAQLIQLTQRVQMLRAAMPR